MHKFVGTRSSAQTRSHAQKYFNKLMRKGTREAEEQLALIGKSGLKKDVHMDESTLDNTLI